jgi:membrane-bound lytic murein transglycosylase B
MKRLFPLFLILASCASSPEATPRAPSSLGPGEYAAQKLTSKGLTPDFLALVKKNYHEDQRDKVLELNLLGFLQTNKSHGDEPIPGWELKRVQQFLTQHRTTFKEAEQEFHVSREVIASLLWVETRHGRDVGHFHVASALYSLVQADYPTLLDGLLDAARKKAPDYDQLMQTRITDHAHAKSDWAAGELVALQEVHQKGWKNAENLYGSFSGAFGMAQFMPSSYLTWAKANRGAKPNLFKADDSILSVANYLSSNGWNRDDRTSQEGALFHYNRDKAYVTHILHMSECLRRPAGKSKHSKRSTASAPPSC